MRVAVMGAGGIGGYFGGLLARSGETVTFIARGAHLEAIQFRGLTVKSLVDGDFTVSVRATSDPEEVGPVDLVLFCVKTYDTDVAAEQIRPLVGPETAVISMQNGVDNAERIARAVGPEAVLCAIPQVSSHRVAPGVIGLSFQSGKAKLALGEVFGETRPRTQCLLDAFQQAWGPTELHHHMHVALWEKFILNCANNGLTTLTRLPMGVILAFPETSSLLRGLMGEVEEVGRACGVTLPAGAADRAFAVTASYSPQMRGSMYHDVAAGRRLELESLNSVVVRLGREHGVPTPLNFAIYAALRPYVDGAPALSEQCTELPT